MNYMTDTEIAALQESGLDKRTPFALYNVSSSQLSVAMYYGGCTFKGKHYVYFPQNDELIRADVVKWLGKVRKGEAKEKLQDTSQKQMNLWDQQNGERWDKITNPWGG